MEQLKLSPRTLRGLSRRALQELGRLQAAVEASGAPRDAALRLFLGARHAITQRAQGELWLEFLRLHREYRTAVRRLAQFCRERRARP